jgi:hypothetical protein
VRKTEFTSVNQPPRGVAVAALSDCADRNHRAGVSGGGSAAHVVHSHDTGFVGKVEASERIGNQHRAA